MTLPYLTDDCIYIILKHLQNNRLTLFNCLLVNRFWCESTIPLLYANPFVNVTVKGYLITLTLIRCFNKEETLQLKEQLGMNRINNISLDEEYKPLFEYPKYLEIYDCNTISIVIEQCFKRYVTGLPTWRKNMYDNTDIIPLFHRSILRQSRNIKQLDNLLDLFYKESFKNFNLQNFTSNLTKLNSLSLDFYLNGAVNNEIEQEFLSNVASNCLNLKKLVVKLPQLTRTLFQHVTSNNLFNTITLEKLCAIIQEQNKLKMFKAWYCHSLLNNILSSLEFQKHSLVHIEIMNTDFSNVSLKSLNNLYNLEYLGFGFCNGISLDQCEVLNSALFKLKELSFTRNNWNADITSLMINCLGASLQRLSIENSTILIENISMYCPNLHYLKIFDTSKHHIDIDLPIFTNLKTRILDITISRHDDEFFINLAINIPINISKISIKSLGNDYNKFLRFKEFLENCHNSFEIIGLNHIIDLKFLKIILNYIERSNNSLKIFGMMKLNKELNDEEIKLLHQIKAKGVKIIEFGKIKDILKDEY